MEYLPETSKVVFCDYHQPEDAEIVECLCLSPRDDGYSFYPRKNPVPAARYADLPKNSREIEVVLAKVDPSLTVKQVIEEIEKDGSRPATYEETWSYVKAFFASRPVWKKITMHDGGGNVTYYDDSKSLEPGEVPKPGEIEAYKQALQEWKELSERMDLVILGSKTRRRGEEHAITIGKQLRHPPHYGEIEIWLIDTLRVVIWERLQGGYIPVVHENFRSCVGAHKSNSKNVSAQAACWQPAPKPWHICCQCTGW
ncbi:MAG: hypothetical protein WC750_02835 [Patescibacteria group bacterium]|jgi:hypothetical protein